MVKNILIAMGVFLLFFVLNCRQEVKKAVIQKIEIHDPFDDVKYYIAKYESGNGKYRIHYNEKGKTYDLGMYQINSVHLRYRPSDTLSCILDSIFTKHRCSRKFKERFYKTMWNDFLNEDLARAIFHRRGIHQWTTSAFKKFLNDTKHLKKERP
jgi:hypothetical protein